MNTAQHSPCPACKGQDACALFTAYDDRYGYPGSVKIVECRACGHKYVDPLLPEDVVRTLYTRYYQRETLDPGAFRPYRLPSRLGAWLGGDAASAAWWVPRNVRVLDIGCGWGANVAFHASRGCDAHGIDADENVRTVAQKYGLNIRIGLFCASDYEPESFDYVTMDQVFEHVTDPVATMSQVHTVLKTGGRFVISTPNADGWGATLFRGKWINWHAPYHQQFPSPRSMALMAERTGFAVESKMTVTRSAWLAYQIAHLLICPPPGRPSAFWAPRKDRLRIGARLCVKLAMATRLTLLPQLVTRLFDALEQGDNYVIILRKKASGDLPAGQA